MGTLSTIIAEIERVLSEVDEVRLDTFADQLLAAPRVFVTGEGRSGLMARAFVGRSPGDIEAIFGDLWRNGRWRVVPRFSLQVLSGIPNG